MSTPAVVDLAGAEQRAEETTAVAEAMRRRLVAGDATVTAAELDGAEQEERHAQRELHAARARDEQRREREAAEELELRRAAIQREWALRQQGEPADLAELRQAAADAAARYLAAYRSRADYLDDLSRRARAAGLRAPDPSERTQRPSPLPRLGDDIITTARESLDHAWLNPMLDSKTTVWGGR